MNIPTESNARGNRDGSSVAYPCITSPIFVEPVNPYASEIPYTIIADDNAPNRKYFKAASLELGFFFIYPTKTYVGILISSHATNNITKSVE